MQFSVNLYQRTRIKFTKETRINETNFTCPELHTTLMAYSIIENSYSLNAVGLGILWLQSCELYILVKNRVASTHKIVRA